MNMLDLLMAIDDHLANWIICASPSTDAEKAQMRELLSLRGKIERQINALIVEKMKLATKDMSREIDRLARLNDRIHATTKSIAEVKEVIGIASETMAIVAQVMTLLA